MTTTPTPAAGTELTAAETAAWDIARAAAKDAARAIATAATWSAHRAALQLIDRLGQSTSAGNGV